MFMVFARLCVCAPRVCSDCLKLQLQTVVSAVWAPGYEPRSSGRGAMLFNHRAVSPVPTMVTRAWRATVIQPLQPMVASLCCFLIMGMPKLGLESPVVSTASSPGVQEQE